MLGINSTLPKSKGWECIGFNDRRNATRSKVTHTNALQRTHRHVDREIRNTRGGLQSMVLSIDVSII